MAVCNCLNTVTVIIGILTYTSKRGEVCNFSPPVRKNTDESYESDPRCLRMPIVNCPDETSGKD